MKTVSEPLRRLKKKANNKLTKQNLKTTIIT